MTVTEALEKLKSYEQTSFALSHAMGLLYYDGVTAAPKGAAAVRSDTTGELSRIDYQLTTAPDTVEMLETLMAARTELDDVTRRKVEEYWRSYDRTRRIPEEEFVAYQKLTTRADDVWQTAKTNNDFALFEPYLQEIFDTLKRFAQYWEPEKAPYETLLDNYERGLTVAACDDFFAALRQKLVPLIQRVTAHADRVDDTPLHADFPIPIQREFSDFVMGVMGIDRNHCIIGETEHPFTITSPVTMCVSPPTITPTWWPRPCTPWCMRAAMPCTSCTPAGSWPAAIWATACPWASTRASPGSMRTSSAAAGRSAPSSIRG